MSFSQVLFVFSVYLPNLLFIAGFTYLKYLFFGRHVQLLQAYISGRRQPLLPILVRRQRSNYGITMQYTLQIACAWFPNSI